MKSELTLNEAADRLYKFIHSMGLNFDEFIEWAKKQKVKK